MSYFSSTSQTQVSHARSRDRQLGVRYTAISAALATLGFVGAATDASAGGIPFAGNRPQSFQFSTDFKDPYDSFGQEAEWNNDRKVFDSSGKKAAGTGGDTFVGLSSRLHYFKLDALPNWGFVVSATVPEIRVQGPGFSASGIGDPLVGGLAWTNPAPNTTVGMQAYVQAPIGASQVSTNTWSFWPSVFVNQWMGNVNLDLLIGGILRGTTHKTGVDDLAPGNTTHANLRLGYSISPPSDPFAIPFVSMDYQKTTRTVDKLTRVEIGGSDSRELALGAGVLFQLKPGMTSIWRQQKTYDQLSVHYAKSVNGKNTSLTDGLFVQYWHYW
ncbi:transporter [Undibacterium arcticum]|uniref:Transporter n=1 Tax=Undibacterium arcticum TaxID=1762892 RepID=A0ABV7FBA7_9BURK